MRLYSECFKRQVVEDLERGRFGSLHAANAHYGITGATTIRKWLELYGKNHLQAKVVRVEKPDEQDRIRKLKGRVVELERALGQTQAESMLNAEFLKLACEALGQEVEGLKKESRWWAVDGGAQGRPRQERALCRQAGMSRQNYYSQRRIRAQLSVDEELVLELIRQERCRQPRLGGRKLRYMLTLELKQAGVEIGRDRFFALLRRHDLLVPRPRRSVRTVWACQSVGMGFPLAVQHLFSATEVASS